MSSPFPWTIKEGWEQLDPGYWITDAAGVVIYAEGGNPDDPDVPLSEEDRKVLKNILWMDKDLRDALERVKVLEAENAELLERVKKWQALAFGTEGARDVWDERNRLRDDVVAKAQLAQLAQRELEFERSTRFALMQGVLDGARSNGLGLGDAARARGFTSRTPKADAYESGYLYAQEERNR